MCGVPYESVTEDQAVCIQGGTTQSSFRQICTDDRVWILKHLEFPHGNSPLQSPKVEPIIDWPHQHTQLPIIVICSN